ncbi:MAG: trypsin-like peptidase domain-containing protein [Phycisphaerales bacterium]
MRRFVTFGPALVVLLTTLVTLVAAPAAVRMIRAADAAARAQAARQALADDDILQRLSLATANVGEAVLPSVVHIDVRTTGTNGFNASSLGSGWVYDERGYIVTNAHVVASATDISVQFNDGRLYDASLVGIDPGTDIAVIRITPLEELLALPRSTEPLQVGQKVYSFGSPFNFKFSMSEGIVSGLGRESTTYANIGGFSNFIQFDAAVNPGNSGGPVVDVLGRVVGVNVAIANNTNTVGTTDQGQSAGISFAIPVRVAEFVAGQLIEDGQVRRGFLGINLPVFDGPAYLRDQLGYIGLGVHVPQVVADGPAARGGLQRDDVITGIDGQRITGVEMLRSIISTMEPGHDARIELWRAGTERTVTVRVGEFERPDLVRQNIITSLVSIGARLERTDPGATPAFDLVIPGSPAARAGLRRGSRVVAVEGSPVGTVQAFCEALDAADLRLRAPVEVTIEVASDEGETRRREITLELPR